MPNYKTPAMTDQGNAGAPQLFQPHEVTQCYTIMIPTGITAFGQFVFTSKRMIF
jgi:hypothetical protein